MTTLDEYITALMRKAQAEFEVKAVEAKMRAEQGWRQQGLDDEEIEARAAEYAATLETWREASIMDIAGTINEWNLKRQGSTVGIAAQSGMRH